MIYYISEKINESMEKNAGSKARNDVSSILHKMNAQEILLDCIRGVSGIKLHINNAKILYNKLEGEKIHDSILIIQFPLFGHSVLNGLVIKNFQKRNNKVILIIHDVDFIRMKKEKRRLLSYYRIRLEELDLLKICDKVIVHNAKMKSLLCKYGIKNEKMIELGIFDYLVDKPEAQTGLKKNENEVVDIAIAGNLIKKKCGYIYKLPRYPEFNLYGSNYEEIAPLSNVNYRGSFTPEELVAELNEKYGLVWDGDSVETCDGNYGEYLKYNNPHKASLYIASELPVIIWKQAALASFIEDNGLGITINSIDEIKEKICQIDKQEYYELKKNVKKTAQKLRNGVYMSDAINKAIREFEVKKYN